jgi:hypothetical protein
MNPELRTQLLQGISDGSIVPYLGPGVLADVVNPANGKAIPADSNSLILAMNNGKPMAPKLMYEFPRAAMNVELKRGRSAIHKFLNQVYGQTEWTRAKVHDWLKAIKPAYVIDINRDTQLQASYADVPHILIVGTARINSGTRYKLYSYDGAAYRAISDEEIPTLAGPVPVLFKPMGTPSPEASYIASDADYVDFITELMGGFAIPPFLKAQRQGKRYLLLGMRLNRDTERMVLSDMIYSAAQPAGWALIPNPTDKERRFSKKLGIELIEEDFSVLL